MEQRKAEKHWTEVVVQKNLIPWPEDIKKQVEQRTKELSVKRINELLKSKEVHNAVRTEIMNAVSSQFYLRKQFDHSYKKIQDCMRHIVEREVKYSGGEGEKTPVQEIDAELFYNPDVKEEVLKVEVVKDEQTQEVERADENEKKYLFSKEIYDSRRKDAKPIYNQVDQEIYQEAGFYASAKSVFDNDDDDK